MKHLSKIFVTLLALAFMISGFAVLAFADDSAAVEYDYGKVLEYYESESYLNATFDGASTLDEALANSTESFSATGKVSYTGNSDGTATMKSLAPLYFDVNTDSTVSFGVNAKVKLDSASSAFSLRLNSVKRGNSNNEVLKLFEINNSSVVVYDGEENSVPKYKTVTVSGADFSVNGAMFALDFYLDTSAATDVATLVITPVGADAVTVNFNVSDFSFKAFDISTNYVTMDYCELYEGSFARRLNENEAAISALVNEIIAEYNKNTAAAAAFDYLETVAKVVVCYGFDSAAIADSANVAIAAVAPAYRDTYISAVNALDATIPYNECLETISELAYYNNFFKNLSTSAYSSVEGIDYAAIDAANDKVDSELERLAKAKEDTLISYEVILSVANVYSASYAELKNVFDVVNKHPICDTYYDENYSADSIVLASRYANAIMTEFEKKDNMAKIFAEQVPIMCNESLSFADRYEAYVLARDNKFTDSTYDEYLEGVTVESLLNDFEATQASIKVVADYAEEFLLKVKEAYLTSSYAVKIVALDAAALYLEDVEVGYPGVSDSIELYNTIRDDIAKKIEATRKYIDAVLAVQAAETVSEKKAAIEVANAYAELGSDVTVEISDMAISVTEANIILSNESSKILLSETTVRAYISAVNSLAAIDDLAQRRSAINKAVALQADVDSSASGVSEADATLSAAIEAYNADVSAANSSSAESNELALGTLSATVPNVVTAQIVAILKKFFE